MTDIVYNKNGIPFDIDAIATDLNGKMDRDGVNEIGYNSSNPFIFSPSVEQGEAYIVTAGFISGGRASWQFCINLPKPIDNDVTTITCNSLVCNIRTNLGAYSPAYVNTGTDLVGKTGYTVICNKCIGNILFIQINLDTALTTSECTNNAPGTLQITGMNLSFS